MMNKEGTTKIWNFMILRAGVLVQENGHISHKGFPNCNFMTPGAKVIILGRGYVGRYSENALSPFYHYIAHRFPTLLIVYNAAFLCHFWLFIFYMMGLLIWALLTTSNFRVSVTLVTVKAMGLLFSQQWHFFTISFAGWSGFSISKQKRCKLWGLTF